MIVKQTNSMPIIDRNIPIDNFFKRKTSNLYTPSILPYSRQKENTNPVQGLAPNTDSHLSVPKAKNEVQNSHLKN